MRVSITYGGYNDRRYSKPWVARITAWPVGKSPELAWGGYVGDSNGGEVEIEAEPGDIIRSGQKDYRKPRSSDNDWYIVMEAGTVATITAGEARKAFNKAKETA